MTLDEFLALPRERRHEVKLQDRKTRRGSYEPRRSYTRDELVTFLREHKVVSSRDLQKKRQRGDPSVHHFIAAFENWNSAMEASFGPRIPELQIDVTPKYLVQCVVQLGLWTYGKWIEAHRKSPRIVPSIAAVRREFGGKFTLLRRFAEQQSWKRPLTRYLKLREEFGRFPRVREAAEAAIDLKSLIRHWGGKRKLDAALRMGQRALMARLDTSDSE